MADFPERRAFPRSPLNQQVLLDIDGRPQTFTVAGVDLSHCGACLNVPLTAPLAAGSRIQVQVPRPSSDSPLQPGSSQRYDAQVVRVDRSSRLLEGLAVSSGNDAAGH